MMKAFLNGRVTRVETKKVGDSVKCDFALASNERFTNSKGEKVERTTFVDCELWDGRAEVFAKYVKKGNLVAVTGDLRQDKWEKDGVNYSKLFVRVEDFDLPALPPKSDSGETVEAEQTVREAVAAGADGKIPF